MKNILFVASEGVPLLRRGGLADVVGSLPKYYDKRYFVQRGDLTEIYVYVGSCKITDAVQDTLLYGFYGTE